MLDGVIIEHIGARVRFEFRDRAARERVLSKLRTVAGPGGIRVDTGGVRKTYVVAESAAIASGVLRAPPAHVHAEDRPKRRKTAKPKPEPEPVPEDGPE